MKQSSRLLSVMILTISLLTTKDLLGQNEQGMKIYEDAFKELSQMIKGEIPMSYKRAVFITENAYLDNQRNYQDYLVKIEELTKLVRLVASADDLIYSKSDRRQMLFSSAIFRVMKDSLIFQSSDTSILYFSKPYTYDLKDFWGEKDWTKMFVTKLLDEQNGNCHSLPALYKILADELGVKAWLALAPNHTYIKQWNERDGWYNTELTTGTFPYDKDIKWNSYIKSESIAEGIYMDTLSTKENIASVITDLVQGYERKFGIEALATSIDWLDTALTFYPDYVNALILRAEFLKKLYQRKIDVADKGNVRKSLIDAKSKKEFNVVEAAYGRVHDIGYRRMPKEMYLNWLFRIQNDTTRKPFEFKNSQPFKKYGYNVTVVTGGNGQNSEAFDEDEIVRIGTVEFNTITRLIVRFVDQQANDIPDEVISRMYDPSVGRWWAPDPLADGYVHFSPYSFVLNNPIKFIDPDGQKVIYINGHWQQGMLGATIGSSRGGQMYWGEGFVGGASRFFNDGRRGNGMFIDASSSWGGDESGSQRYDRGYQYAKDHYEELIADMAKNETFKIVTHSEGSAFGAGLAAYLLEAGQTVETMVHLSPDEADEFETPEGPNTYQINYDGDPVVGTQQIKGVDKSGVVDKFSKTMDKLQYSHGSTKGAGVWKEVRALLDVAIKGAKGVNITETKSGVKFTIVRDNTKKEEEKK